MDSRVWLIRFIRLQLPQLQGPRNATLFNFKAIVTILKQCGIAKINLDQEKREAGKKSYWVIQSCPTPWNSDLCLIQRNLKLSESLAAVIASNLSPNRPAFLEPDELNVLRETEQLLVPFEWLTKNICTDGEPTISLVIPQTTNLFLFLAEVRMEYVVSMNLRDAQVTQANKYLSPLESNVDFGLATLLDPRY